MAGVTTQSTTLATIPSGIPIATDVVGSARAPATNDLIQYVKLDVGVAGSSSPVTPANPLPVSAPAVTKGTQGANGFTTQDLKDAGRTAITLFLDAVAGITTEALATMQINKGGVAQAAATSYTVTAGKTFRISGIHTTVKNTSTVASDSRVRVRQAAAVLVSSPIVLLNEAGSPAAIAQAAGTDDTVMPDGYEIAGGQQVGISHIESATTCTVSVMVVGYEY